MPVTGFENNGTPVFPKGFDNTYDLFLTVDATGKGTVFEARSSVTLWADPKGNDGAPSVSETSDPSFANGMRGDIALATVTNGVGAFERGRDRSTTRRLRSGADPNGDSDRSCRLERSAPAPSWKSSSSDPSTVTASLPQTDGTTINLVSGGIAKISFPAFDAVQYQNNVFSTVQSDSTFLSHRIDPITGFTSNDQAVVPDGFGTSYGLYFDTVDTGVSTPTSLSFSSSTFRLMYDPGNQDGAVTSTVDGITFANTGGTGAADDIVLGTGTMVSGVASLDPATGFRTTHFVENFTPAPDTIGLSPFLHSTAVFDLVNTRPRLAPGQHTGPRRHDRANAQRCNRGGDIGAGHRRRNHHPGAGHHVRTSSATNLRLS